MADHHQTNLHIAVFPWLAFGHLLPFLQLSKSLAHRGHRISFISTPRNLQRLPTTPSHSSPLITLIPLPKPQITNLPQDAESTADITPDHIDYLWKAFDALQTPLTTFLQTSRPDFVICDFASDWLSPIAAKLDIPCVFFNIFGAPALAFYGSEYEITREDGGSRLTPEEFTVPPKWIPFPSNLALRLNEAVQYSDAGFKKQDSRSPIYRAGLVIRGCEFVAMRSCNEYEGEWLSLLQEELYMKPVVPVGLLPPVPTSFQDEKWAPIKDWLDKQEEGSVVYIAFGSESALSQKQVTELAHGLELSELPFFWVIRRPPGLEEAIVLPSGFEDRVKDRGHVTMEWVPQLSILAHRSLGGFLTHGGWSSIIEGLGFGLALVILPMSQPQGLNARVLEWKKAGLEIPKDGRDGSFDRKSVAESLRVVMVDKEGEVFRTNAKKLKQIFGDNERHDRYMDEFDQRLRETNKSRV